MHAAIAIIDKCIGTIFNVKKYVEWGVCGKRCVGTEVTKSPRVNRSVYHLLFSMQEVFCFDINTFAEYIYGWVECHVVPFKVPVGND